jgi:ribosome biogenesis protein MAK21
MLNKEQGDVAGKMIDVYFEVFGDVLGRLPEKKEDESDAEEEQKKEKKPEKGQKRKRGDKADKGGAQTSPAAVGEMDSKLVAAVLTGINRAFPFATIDDEA